MRGVYGGKEREATGLEGLYDMGNSWRLHYCMSGGSGGVSRSYGYLARRWGIGAIVSGVTRSFGNHCRTV